MTLEPVTPQDLPRELEVESGGASPEASQPSNKKRRPSMEMVGPRPLVVAEQPDPLGSERSLSSPPRPPSATGRPSSSASSPRVELRGMLTRASSSSSRRGSHDTKTKAALSAASSDASCSASSASSSRRSSSSTTANARS